MSITPDQLRSIMRGVPAPVGVLVARGGDGTVRGMTASSMTSVSLAPPLISLNVMAASQMHGLLASAAHFTFNLLGADQEELALRFATGGLSPDQQFLDLTLHQRDRALILPGVRSWMLCAIHAQHPVGDHTILVGRVLAGRIASPEQAPMVVYDGAFHAVGQSEGEPPSPSTVDPVNTVVANVDPDVGGDDPT